MNGDLFQPQQRRFTQEEAEAIQRLAADCPALDIGIPIAPEDLADLQRDGSIVLDIRAGSLAMTVRLIYREDWPLYVRARRVSEGR